MNGQPENNVAGTRGEAARKPHMLIVDDEVDFAEFLADVAEGVGFHCTVATDLEGFEAALKRELDVILLDLVMPEADGVELLRRLAGVHHPAGIVLMSGFDKRVLGSAKVLATELGLQVRGHVEKPVRLSDLETFLVELLAIPDSPTQRMSVESAVSPAELAGAIRDKQFELHYQPQIRIGSGDLAGVEALVRWRHPHRGLVYPDAFIQLAEETRQIDALSWVIFEQALVDCAKLCDLFGPIKLSLNLSACSLEDLELPDKLVTLSRQAGLEPSCLVLEVTESGLMRKLSSALDILTRLRMKGMGLSIDDFGTGYSMMDQVRRVPATELKIDRSFISDSGTDESALVMVEKTIEIGRRLDMEVVAEGVETEQHLAMLRRLECDLAQGYLFSRPVALPDLVSWVPQQGLRSREDGRPALTG